MTYSSKACSVPGCGMIKAAKGMCSRHYAQQRYASIRKEVSHCPTCTCPTSNTP